MEDLNRVMKDRRRKLAGLYEGGTNPFANDWPADTTCAAALDAGDGSPDMNAVPEGAPAYRVAGRIIGKNRMGKAMFLRIRDRSVGLGEEDLKPFLQVHVRKDIVGVEAYDVLKSLDVGDIIGARGPMFTTRTGEVTLLVHEARLLTKSLRPLPEKHHGLTDVETRFRQRYVDLIANAESRKVAIERSRIIDHIRRFLMDRDFLEVETPMMQAIPGGATARPFETFHNALKIPLYLRIAPELYLKRLLVGGLERVFEINRNFRNEGLSPKHNPEFTMLEFYQSYATYDDLISMTEELFEGIARSLNGGDGTVRPYGEHTIDYARPFARHTMAESLSVVGGMDAADVADPAKLRALLESRGHALKGDIPYGKLLPMVFEEIVEEKLIQPTFITQFPIEISPLSRRNEADPAFTDRFELFIAGNEIANAFSELNDPIDQKERFEAQVEERESGDDEAMYMDLDYVRALEYGMPPAAGEGIGIDRLVMLMTDKQTIREVILFPHMRPEQA